uniref:Uncharacterized protein n=1 Tax=Panagrolaimus sp. ES5 TaxID=591445 RepID=A0AC34GXL7_9BILA
MRNSEPSPVPSPSTSKNSPPIPSSRKKTIATMRAENMQKKAELNIHFKKCNSKCSSCCHGTKIEKHIEVTNGFSKYMSLNEEYGALESVRLKLSRDKDIIKQYMDKVFDIKSIITDTRAKNLDLLYEKPEDFEYEEDMPYDNLEFSIEKNQEEKNVCFTEFLEVLKHA